MKQRTAINIVLEPANQEEVPEIRSLAGALDLDCNGISPGQFILAKRDGAILGFGRLKRYDNWCELATLGVIKEEQGKGIGTAIVCELLKNEEQYVYVTCVIPGYFSRFGFAAVEEFPEVLSEKYDFCRSFGFAKDEVFVMKRGGKK